MQRLTLCFFLGYWLNLALLSFLHIVIHRFFGSWVYFNHSFIFNVQDVTKSLKDYFELEIKTNSNTHKKD